MEDKNICSKSAMLLHARDDIFRGDFDTAKRFVQSAIEGFEAEESPKAVSEKEQSAINDFYKKLQNGSDIRGYAVSSEQTPANLNMSSVHFIGLAIAKLLEAEHKGSRPIRVAIGQDSRITGSTIAASLALPLLYSGFDVSIEGFASTPAMFMCTVLDKLDYDCGIMITASHLPYDRNGIKLFTKKGGLEKSDIAGILSCAARLHGENGDAPLYVTDTENPLWFSGAKPKALGNIRSSNIMMDYCEFLKNKIKSGCGGIDEPLKGLHIIVDAGNGSGGFFAEQVLLPLGADISGSINLTPDGLFPNHTPNPEDSCAMRAICDAAISSGADLGIIFDADVDRAGAVLRGGRALNRNALIAMLSAIVLREKGGTIVTDSVTSDALAEFIASHGGVHRRFKRGYRNVINESIRLNKEGTYSPLAIETSGHAAFAENYFLDDGAYVIVKLITELCACKKTGLEALIADLREPKSECETRIAIKEGTSDDEIAKIFTELEQLASTTEGFCVAPDNHEGIRINIKKYDGWFLLRKSLHDPLLVLNTESEQEFAGEIRDFVLSTLSGKDFLSIK